MPKWDVHFDMRVGVDAPEVVRLVSRATARASVIRDIPIPPPVRARMNRLNIMRAVRGTTGIEGTELTEAEVSDVLAASEQEPVLSGGRRREEREVRNARRLMDEVATYLKQHPGAPLTEDVIRWMHEIVTAELDYPNNTPGRYRQHNVNAGDYLCPEHGLVPALMAELVRWLNTGPPSHWDPVVHAIVAHFYVVSIHPFADGNGRTSRGVESYLLYPSGINALGFHSLANYYYRNRADYVEQLTRARFLQPQDLTPFVLFSLRGLVEELAIINRDILDTMRTIAFRDYARETLARDGKLGRPGGDRMLNFLTSLPDGAISLADLRNGRHPLSHLYRNVTSKTLSRDINYLVEQGLIVADDGHIRANTAAMDQFTTP